MKKDELHARVLYLYQILRHYSDSEHPLTTQQILKIMDEKYHIQIHRVSVQNYVEIYIEKLIIFLEVLICRYSLFLQAFAAFFFTEDVLKSSYIPSCFHVQK